MESVATFHHPEFCKTTKNSFSPIDSLLRVAVSDMILSGIVPPSCDDLLQTKVSEFSKCLVVSVKKKSDRDTSMLYTQHGDGASCIDTQISIF